MLSKLRFGRTRALFYLFVFFLGIASTWGFSFIKQNYFTTPSPHCLSYTVNRVEGFDYIRPVLSIERKIPSARFKPIGQDLQYLIDSLKNIGVISDASVYLEDFNQGRWTNVYADKKYHPASLMKVALMIGYLKMAEDRPELLKEERLFVAPPVGVIPPQLYQDEGIESGKKYTVHDLLYYMIAYSDNKAAWLLSQNFDNNIIYGIFKQLNLPIPPARDQDFTMSPRELSMFYKAIYNASILSPEYSEYAAQMLAQTRFKSGFAAGFPPNTKMMHKFGEWNQAGLQDELHESGIVYIKNTPFSVHIMTRGQQAPALAAVIQLLTERLYNGILNNAEFTEENKTSFSN